MRGEIDPQASLFSYVDLESRIPKDHPIRKIRDIVDTALQEIEPWFDEMYATVGRPSIPPQMLLRASLLQILFTVHCSLFTVHCSLRAPIVRANRLRPDASLVCGPGHG